MSPNRNITIHHSFEEMEVARSRDAASVDPVIGLRQTVELILRVYGTNRNELKSRFEKNMIIITATG
jgi:hypothetical protein